MMDGGDVNAQCKPRRSVTNIPSSKMDLSLLTPDWLHTLVRSPTSSRTSFIGSLPLPDASAEQRRELCAGNNQSRVEQGTNGHKSNTHSNTYATGKESFT